MARLHWFSQDGITVIVVQDEETVVACADGVTNLPVWSV